MTLNKSSHKQFSAMFWQSVKKTCFFPIAAFACLLFETLIYSSERRIVASLYGFFWNDFSGPLSTFAIAGFIGAGFINAVLLYKFISSRKQCNVVFSLGMTKNDIFLSRYIAGMIPMLISIVVAGIIQVISLSVIGYEINSQILMVMLYMIVAFYAGYALSFTLTSAVFCNIGNPFEGVVFTAIIGIFPTVALQFVKAIFNFYTLGSFYQDLKWNWFNPFASIDNFQNNHPNYFEKTQTPDTLNVFDFSGMITAFVLVAVIFTITLITFNRHKNEISGSWGRAKGLNEICGAFVGFYALTLFIAILGEYYGHGNGSFGTFILCFVAFLVAYVVFKLIFSGKRKKSLLNSLKRSPAYLVGFAVVTIIFSTGLFGYSSFIPSIDDIQLMSVSSQLWAYNDSKNFNSSTYGLARATSKTYADDESSNFILTNKSDIEEFIKIHKLVIDDGKIRNNSPDACGNSLYIKYTLKNGEVVYRFYTETTTQTANKMLNLNNLNNVKDNLRASILSSYESNKSKLEIYDSYDSGSYYYSNNYSFDSMFVNNMYIYSKSLTNGYYAGKLTDELFYALVKDIYAQTADNTFRHTPDSELGVLSFGVGNDTFLDRSYVYVEDKEQSTEYCDPSVGGTGIAKTSWNLKSSDISTFVITKDMTNTIKYLQENDLMKYMTTDITANDIKSIKVATLPELYNDNSQNVPVFYAGFCTKESINAYSPAEHHAFSKINNEITNKTTIQKVLDNSFIYGFFDNDYRIVEITYNDGSIGTRCITLDTYNAIVK